jgi:hypothetical protein
MPFFKITLFSFIRDLSHCRVFWSKVLLVARVVLSWLENGYRERNEEDE